MNRRNHWLLLTASLLMALGALGWAGILRPNQLVVSRYAVRGVDVSEYQGTIYWNKLSAGQDFAFIKATEGSSHQDPAFAANFQGAAEAGLLSGAYHFFSFESPGETQAENFLQTVGSLSGRLPPVVDVELYGRFKKEPPALEDVRAKLDPLLAALESHYGAKPIL